MDSPFAFRLAAAGFVTAILVLAILQARLPAPTSAPPVVPPPAIATRGDPLRTEQRRCQALGAAGAQDTACLKTWARTRARFIGAGA
jgi:conjugative transfer region protein TrbK